MMIIVATNVVASRQPNADLHERLQLVQISCFHRINMWEVWHEPQGQTSNKQEHAAAKPFPVIAEVLFRFPVNFLDLV